MRGLLTKLVACYLTFFVLSSAYAAELTACERHLVQSILIPNRNAQGWPLVRVGNSVFFEGYTRSPGRIFSLPVEEARELEIDVDAIPPLRPMQTQSGPNCLPSSIVYVAEGFLAGRMLQPHSDDVRLDAGNFSGWRRKVFETTGKENVANGRAQGAAIYDRLHEMRILREDAGTNGFTNDVDVLAKHLDEGYVAVISSSGALVQTPWTEFTKDGYISRKGSSFAPQPHTGPDLVDHAVVAVGKFEHAHQPRLNFGLIHVITMDPLMGLPNAITLTKSVQQDGSTYNSLSGGYAILLRIKLRDILLAP